METLYRVMVIELKDTSRDVSLYELTTRWWEIDIDQNDFDEFIRDADWDELLSKIVDYQTGKVGIHCSEAEGDDTVVLSDYDPRERLVAFDAEDYP